MSELPGPDRPRCTVSASDLDVEMRGPDFWRDRAEQVRTKAAFMRDANARRMMEAIAKNYHKLADWAARRRCVMPRVKP